MVVTVPLLLGIDAVFGVGTLVTQIGATVTDS
jgi:hypothetical protein